MRSGSWNGLNLQVKETLSCTIVRESAVVPKFFLALADMKVGQGLSKHAIPWFVVVGVWRWT